MGFLQTLWLELAEFCDFIENYRSQMVTSLVVGLSEILISAFDNSDQKGASEKLKYRQQPQKEIVAPA